MMAITLLILTVVLASIVNGYVDDEVDGFGPNLIYHYVEAPSLPTPSRLRSWLPDLPELPPLPSPPPLLMLGPSPFRNIPGFRQPEFLQPDFLQPEFLQPDFPQPEFPSIEEIITASPEPGGTYDGVVIVSKSKSTRDEDGKITRKGGSTMMLNDNGHVTENKIGDSPPEIIIKKEPSFFDFPEKFKLRRPHMPFEFPLIKPYEYKKFDIDAMKNYVPKEGERMFATSSSSHSFSTNENGVKTSGGSRSSMTNIDGDVEEKKRAFVKSDPKPEYD